LAKLNNAWTSQLSLDLLPFKTSTDRQEGGNRGSWQRTLAKVEEEYPSSLEKTL
jgi:hypothetical protein